MNSSGSNIWKLLLNRLMIEFHIYNLKNCDIKC